MEIRAFVSFILFSEKENRESVIAIMMFQVSYTISSGTNHAFVVDRSINQNDIEVNGSTYEINAVIILYESNKRLYNNYTKKVVSVELVVIFCKL